LILVGHLPIATRLRPTETAARHCPPPVKGLVPDHRWGKSGMWFLSLVLRPDLFVVHPRACSVCPGSQQPFAPRASSLTPPPLSLVHGMLSHPSTHSSFSPFPPFSVSGLFLPSLFSTSRAVRFMVVSKQRLRPLPLLPTYYTINQSAFTLFPHSLTR